jgi:hypothetical protein
VHVDVYLLMGASGMFARTLTMLVALSWCAGIATGAGPIDFAKQIEPLLVERCAKCHGEAKAQAKLRLDSIADIEARLKEKPQLVVAGKPDESLLYQRLTLPADNPKRMPKGGDPLAKDQLELVAQWIKQGAMLTAASAAKEAPAAAVEPAAIRTSLPEVATAPMGAVEKLVAAGARVTPLFGGSNLLDVSFAGRGKPADDADVALLAGIAEQVYTLNLADAKLTAAGVTPLAAMKHLNALHLERASIDDDALSHVRGLQELEYLNLYGTPITDAGLKYVSGLARLRKLYLWQTKASYDAAMAMEKTTPGLMVDLGYDHPVVARNRLTKELEDTKQQLEAAKAAVAKQEEELGRLKKDVESRAARLGEIEKELKGLAAPGGS